MIVRALGVSFMLAVSQAAQPPIDCAPKIRRAAVSVIAKCAKRS
jgi:hypothetical protein